MRYLGLALFAEGNTDHRFLSPILRRTIEALCLRYSSDIVEIGDVLELHSPPQHRDRDRATRIMEAAKEAQGAYNVLFIHADGAGSPSEALEQRVQPAIQRMIAAFAPMREQTVAVVPVRETEAWALADGKALRAAFGTMLNDLVLGIPPRPRDVERILDPKLALNQVFERVVESGGRKKRKAAAFLDVIGEQVRLPWLRQVPAFRLFEQNLCRALTDLGYLTLEHPS